MTPMLEYWKPVVGFESKYQVSNTGHVQSMESGKLLKGWFAKGYRKVELWRDGKPCRCSVHSLIAAAFIGMRPLGLHINHKNGWKKKNWASNLEYISQAENNRHAIRTGLNRATTGNLTPFVVGHSRKLSDAQIEEIKQLSSTTSNAQLARMFEVHDSFISRVKRGLRRSA